jgi:hypothetical protein
MFALGVIVTLVVLGAMLVGYLYLKKEGKA